MLLPGLPSPIPDESLNGYLLRLTEVNGYVNLPQLHKVAGYRGNPLSFRKGYGEQMAKLIGMTPEQLEAMSYERGSTAAERRSASFLGHDVSAAMLDSTDPKVCPACVVKDGHLKALWDLTPVIACPTHGTLLLTTCPYCQRHLSWRRPGLITCACENSWHDVVPPKADDAVVAMMRLISAKVENRAVDDMGPFPKQLADLPLADLLMLIATVGWWSTGGSSGSGLRDFHALKPAERIPLITTGVQVFTGWPHRFWAFLDQVRGQQPHETAAGHPLRKEMGNLRAMLIHGLQKPEGAFIRQAVIEWRDRTWPDIRARTKRSRAAMSPEEREKREWAEAGGKIGIGPSAARKTVLAMGLAAEDITALASTLAQRTGLKEGAAHIGMSIKTMRSFVNAGLVPFDTNLIDDGRRDRTFLISDLDALIERFRWVARPMRLAPRSTQIRQMSESFRLFSCAEWPITEIILRMEDGRIPVWYDGEAAPRLLNQFHVDLDDVRQSLYAWLEATNPGWITVYSASKLLGIGPDAVLIRAGKGQMPSLMVTVGPRNYRLVKVD